MTENQIENPQALNPIVVEKRKFKNPDNIRYSYSILWSDRPFKRGVPI